MTLQKNTPDATTDKVVDEAFDHLCNLLAAESMLRLLSSESLNVVGLAITALIHAEDSDPDCAGAVTPVETLVHAAGMMNDPARNAVGSIACALVNMQSAIQRNPKSVMHRMTAALDCVRPRKAAKIKRAVPQPKAHRTAKRKPS